MTRILGIDPGLNICGYGVIESHGNGARLVEAGVIRTKPKSSLPSRLAELHEGLLEIIESLRPDRMALEQLFSHYERPRTAILMGHARGVICLNAQLAGLEIEHYEPTRVKKLLTGNGRAPKSQMQLAVKLQLNLATEPDPPDVADALAIALCGHYFSKFAAI
ncbi:crossover junction endodeoxyribonuclease RuvC [Planctomycetaceae bacterium SH139]